MDIILFVNKSDNNVVSKTISSPLQKSGVELLEDTSIINPSIIITGNIPTYNYLYIPIWGRYYYINNVTSVKNGVWRIDCKVDVLMSFKSQFMDQEAIVKRQEKVYNLYVDDGRFYVINKMRRQVKQFPNSFHDSGRFVMAVQGGVV